MRCQKVRSCLSAFCNDELSGSAFAKVSDHLASCAGCRAEEQHFRALQKGKEELNVFRVSEGFNNRLLDRIAHERFAETRTKAYFPNNAPSIVIRRVVPILATSFLAVALIAVNFWPNFNSRPDGMANIAVNDVQLDDSYLTVQPVNNPNMMGTLRQGWTLSEQLARADRMNRISKQLTSGFSFDNYYQGNATNVSTRTLQPLPYVNGHYRIVPVIRVFEPANPNATKEVEVTY